MGQPQLTIQVKSDHPSVQATGQGKMPLEPMSASRFFNGEACTQIEFAKDGSEVTLYQSGQAPLFKREGFDE
jgi:hypothetical protein